MGKKTEVRCIFNLYVHSKIFEHVGSNTKIVKYKKICSYLQQWRIPKYLRVAILKELEQMCLIKKVSRNYIIIENPKVSFEDISKIYNLVDIN